MSMNEIIMEQSRTAYSFFSVLCSALMDFSYNEDAKTTKQLMTIIKSIKVGMPLPSGRWGNSLAVALEMQLYQGALLMIKNAEELEIDLESVSSEYGGKNVWNAQQTYEISKLGFAKKKIADNDEFYKKNPWLIQSINSNIDAALEISSILQGKVEKNDK